MLERTDSLRIAVAEDRPFFRDGLVLQLQQGGIEVTAVCDSADELMRRIPDNPPDLVCLDICLPPTFTDEGIQAAVQIRSQWPDIGVLILSAYAESAYAEKVVSIGRSIGYLVKDSVADLDSLLDALHRIRNGDCVIPAEIIQTLIRRPPHQEALSRLTERETSVLKLMAEGHSNARIAEELIISERTVEARTKSIFEKLDLPQHPDAHRRVQAVVTWLRQN